MITTDLTAAKAVTEAKRVEKLAEDMKAYGGEHTMLTDQARINERQAIIDASAVMQTDIQNATTEAELKGYMDAMNS